jgi:hypothetical protein
LYELCYVLLIVGNFSLCLKPISRSTDESCGAENHVPFDEVTASRHQEKIMSSATAVSSLSILQELQSFYQTRQTDLTQLGSDLKSGNLSGAQQVFNALSALGENGPFANSQPFSNSTSSQAFNALGQDLQAGNLTAAQADFATLTGNQVPTTAAANPATTPAAIVSLTSTLPSTTAANTTTTASSIYQQLQAYRQQQLTDLTQLGQDLEAGNLTAAQQDFNTLTTLGQSGPNQNGQTFQQAAQATDFQAIGQALQNGDLAGAQAAFVSLANTISGQSPQAQTAISAYNSNSSTTQITINLGAASSTAASTASASTASTTPEVVINTAQGTSSFSGISEIVVNFGAASTANASTTEATPGELVVNFGQGSAPEELTVNLGSSGAQVTIESTEAAQAQSTQAQGTLAQSTQALNTNANDATQATSTNSATQAIINFNTQSNNNYEIILNLLNASATSTSTNALSVSA